jgi:hypothetical protein
MLMTFVYRCTCFLFYGFVLENEVEFWACLWHLYTDLVAFYFMRFWVFLSPYLKMRLNSELAYVDDHDPDGWVQYLGFVLHESQGGDALHIKNKIRLNYNLSKIIQNVIQEIAQEQANKGQAFLKSLALALSPQLATVMKANLFRPHREKKD